MSEKKSCASCAFCVMNEYGYSEHTIIGAIYTCLGDLNPGFPLDDADDKNGALEFAEGCMAFREGTMRVTGLRVEDPKREFIDWSSQFAASEPRK